MGLEFLGVSDTPNTIFNEKEKEFFDMIIGNNWYWICI